MSKGTCERCFSEGVQLKAFERNREDGGGLENLCEFCAATLLGNIAKYPEMYRASHTLAVGLIQALNLLAQKIEGQGKQ